MFQNLKKLSDEEKKFGDFAPYKAGNYIFRVSDVEVGTTPVKEWKGTCYVETGDVMPQLTLFLDIYKMNGTNEVEKVDKTIIVNPKMRLWVNDTNLGWNKKENRPKDGRAAIAALYGIEPDAELPLADPAELINKKFSAYMTVETKKDVSRNRLIDIVPYVDAIPGLELDTNEKKNR